MYSSGEERTQQATSEKIHREPNWSSYSSSEAVDQSTEEHIWFWWWNSSESKQRASQRRTRLSWCRCGLDRATAEVPESHRRAARTHWHPGIMEILFTNYVGLISLVWIWVCRTWMTSSNWWTHEFCSLREHSRQHPPFGSRSKALKTQGSFHRRLIQRTQRKSTSPRFRI